MSLRSSEAAGLLMVSLVCDVARMNPRYTRTAILTVRASGRIGMAIYMHDARGRRNRKPAEMFTYPGWKDLIGVRGIGGWREEAKIVVRPA